MKIIKKADLLLIFLLAVIPFCMLAYNIISAAEIQNPRLVILLEGEMYGSYPLTEDLTIEIGDTNTCQIRDGQVRMLHADCPDQVCVRTVPIGKYGGTIVCVPNRIVLTIENADANPDSDAPDAVAT